MRGTWTVWARATAQEPPDLRDLLGAEFDRYARATDAGFRARMLSSRVLALRLASAVVGGPVRLVKDALGNPGLARPDGAPVRGVDVSLAHTGGVVAAAVSVAGRVGVDVEPLGRDLGAAGDRAFHPEECRADPVRGWTVKEAVAKAVGRGLLLDLRTVRADAPPPGWRVRSEAIGAYRLTTALGPWEGCTP
ncbi:4'-phosphopantetheinyl transferase family protein [Actinokineospora pegani]|uniref:4'-phosphopantetheinyl transferase family protein n=1 Tax=Actinokineospora pegani TaxID=2654637 RepID=UPI0012E9C7C7|nr:4'-phosphopantetheinyl transferase superfamily protein [Actinokineospora pegani]